VSKQSGATEQQQQQQQQQQESGAKRSKAEQQSSSSSSSNNNTKTNIFKSDFTDLFTDLYLYFFYLIATAHSARPVI